MPNTELIADIHRHGAIALVHYRKTEACDKQGIDLSGANFDNLDLTDIDFTDANIEDANFVGTILRNAVFDSTRMNGASFIAARLHKCRIVNTVGQNCNFTAADLTNVQISASKLDGAWFVRTCMRDVTMKDTLALGSRFEATSLTATRLERIDLRRSIISSLTLNGDVVLIDCNLRSIVLNATIVNDLKAHCFPESHGNFTTLKRLAMQRDPETGTLVPDPRFIHCRGRGHAPGVPPARKR